MAATQGQIVNLHIAGAATLPSPYPERGDISFRQRGGGDNQEPYWIARVTRRISPTQTNSYLVLIEHIAAIAWANDDQPIDPETGEWWLRRDIKKRVNEDSGRTGRGVVFVYEHLPIIVKSQIATTAGESAEYMCIPCCPDR